MQSNNKQHNPEPIYLAKGKRSNVFLVNFRGKKAVIKKSLPNLQHTQSRIQHEANILKLLNKHKIGPKLYASKSIKENNQEINQLTEEYIEGITIEKFLKTETNKIKITKIIKQILNQCRTLDKLKINKEEMSNPYKHVIIKKIKQNNKIILKSVMIDFERARFSSSPANVTQFFQYIMHHKLVKLDEETKELLKNYKTNQVEENYKKLLTLL